MDNGAEDWPQEERNPHGDEQGDEVHVVVQVVADRARDNAILGQNLVREEGVTSRHSPEWERINQD